MPEKENGVVPVGKLASEVRCFLEKKAMEGDSPTIMEELLQEFGDISCKTDLRTAVKSLVREGVVVLAGPDCYSAMPCCPTLINNGWRDRLSC